MANVAGSSDPKCDRCQTPMERYAVPGTGGKEQAWRLACPCQHSATPDVARASKERPLLDVIRDIRDMLGVIAPADFVDPAGDKMRAAESAWCLADNVLFAATVAPAPETPPTSKELSDKLRECLEAAKGFGNSTFAPVPFAIVQQLIELLAPDHETLSVEPFPDTLVRWMTSDTWRCRCTSTGNINIKLCNYCGGCGTHRPEKAPAQKASEGPG